MLPWNRGAEDVMKISKEFAQRHNHAYVAPSHILAGLFGECYSIAGCVLTKSGLDARMVLAEIAKKDYLKNFDSDYQSQDLPWTDFAVLITKKAPMIAQHIGHSYVGTEHLLLAICQLTDYCGPNFLDGIVRDLKIDFKKVREELLEAMDFIITFQKALEKATEAPADPEKVAADFLLEPEENDSDFLEVGGSELEFALEHKPQTEEGVRRAAKSILEKYTKRRRVPSHDEPLLTEFAKQPAHIVILKEIVGICRAGFGHDQETYFRVFRLIVLCELLCTIEIPKREIEHAIHTLATMQSRCSLDVLVETIDQLREYFYKD